MKENGITKNKAKKINHFLKEDYFKNIDSEAKAYFLGLMKTDGYVKNYKGDSYTIGISLKESDKEILEKFKQELNLSSSLYHDKRPKKEAYVLEFTSEQMAKDLKYFDIIPKKTYFLDDIHLELIPKEFQRHYLRGLLDGDGAVFKEKTQIVVSFCGYSQNFVRSFQKAINNAIQYEYSGAIIKTNAWQCKWKGNKLAEKILSYLYEDSSFYLTRKKQFYDLLK